ncbi:MAG TPA: cytochrome D1 domain-containing protein, partial [Paracoccaceae bacterium]
MNRFAALLALLAAPALAEEPYRSTGDLGLIVERATGSLLVIDQSERATLGRIEGLGDLSHASLVFSPDERFAFVFGRDGGLTKVDILTRRIVGRVMQAGNSIGGAISDDGRLVAVANYEPGGVRIFDADTLEMLADIPTGAKTLGLEEAQGRRFVFSMWETGETWIADLSGALKLTKFTGIGANPYDALVTDNGRTYIAGLFGEDGLTAIDLWDEAPEPRRILPGYGKGLADLPVYKMPHLETWAETGDQIVLPAVG